MLLLPPCYPGSTNCTRSSIHQQRRSSRCCSCAATPAANSNPRHGQWSVNGVPKRVFLLNQAAVAATSYGQPSDDGSKQQEQLHGAANGAIMQGASMPATVFNLVNVIMGAGYVSIPFALRQGGWAALAILGLLGAVFLYTGMTVLQCCSLVAQETTNAAVKAQSPSSTILGSAWIGYEAAAGYAFGHVGLAVVSGIMYAELLGICCVYVVLEAETLSTLLGASQFGKALQAWLGPGAWVLLASALMAPTVLLPDLNALSVLGAMGVCAAATVALTLAVMSCNASFPALPATSLIQLSTLPQVLGVLAFVYAGHSTFPVIQRSMQQPSAGARAVFYGYVATFVICAALGAFGYSLYGPSTAAVITASLPAGTAVAIACTALTACNPFSAFALTLEPVAVAIQQRVTTAWQHGQVTKGSSIVNQGRSSSSNSHSKASGSNAADQSQVLSSRVGQEADRVAQANTGAGVPYHIRALVRLGLALACCCTALALPYVADLMAFVGALLTMSISLIMPALMHIKLMWQELPWWGVAFDVLVLLLGVTCAGVGATSALQSLQQKLSHTYAVAAVAAAL